FKTFKPFNRCAPFKSFYNRRTNSNRSNGSIARAVPNVITLNVLRKKYRRWEQVSTPRGAVQGSTVQKFKVGFIRRRFQWFQCFQRFAQFQLFNRRAVVQRFNGSNVQRRTLAGERSSGSNASSALRSSNGSSDNRRVKIDREKICWSGSIAVGSRSFVERVKSELGFKAAHRDVIEADVKRNSQVRPGPPLNPTGFLKSF
ncbi:MAG: hypothetical protein ACXWX7_07030, partial [Candidatus Binatia bacterium]